MILYSLSVTVTTHHTEGMYFHIIHAAAAKIVTDFVDFWGPGREKRYFKMQKQKMLNVQFVIPFLIWILESEVFFIEMQIAKMS